MSTQKQEYRGYTITVTPIQGHDDLWGFDYLLSKDGEAMPANGPRAARADTAGTHQEASTACDAGFEVAKIEVDNLLALH